MNSAVVKVQNVHKNFGQLKALNDVSLSLPQGQLLGLLGHNGAGKTTLIKLILGLSTPDGGQVEVLGQNPATNRDQLSLGYLPEHVSLYGNLTGFELLNYFAKLRGVKPARVFSVLEQLQLQEAQHRLVKTYSKGMRQRLALGQAILANPKVLILDEPTVGLDPEAAQMLYGQVLTLKQQGCAVIVCTHELTLVDNHLDQAMVMAKGHCIKQGRMEELRNLPELKTRIELGGAALLAQKDPELGQYFDLHHNQFSVVAEQKSWLVERLTEKHQRFDLNVLPPSLVEIYHSCQRHTSEIAS